MYTSKNKIVYFNYITKFGCRDLKSELKEGSTLHFLLMRRMERM